jgi:hypothetical protein
MGMNAVLCTLSAKRLAQLEAEPDLLRELLAARLETDIPGLLDIGKTWEALDFIISERGKEPVLADAVLARTGQQMRAAGAYGPARLLAPARVVQVSAALAALPADVVRQRYTRLGRMDVHGGYGREVGRMDDAKFLRDKVRETHDREIGELATALAGVVALYARAATSGHSVMSVIV